MERKTLRQFWRKSSSPTIRNSVLSFEPRMAWRPYTQFGYQNSPTIRLSVLSFGPRRERNDIHPLLIQWNIIMPVQLSEQFLGLGWCHSYECKLSNKVNDLSYLELSSDTSDQEISETEEFSDKTLISNDRKIFVLLNNFM